jgi:hypothetical protein
MKMHYCTARLNLSGQGFHIIHYGKHEPLSWPELQVLMQLHGDENVMDIVAVAIGETTPNAEKRRLLAKYRGVVEAVFPGRVPRMEMLLPDTDAENLPRVDEFGEAMQGQVPDNGDDEDEGDDDLSREPPVGTPVFRPSPRNIHRPQRPEAAPPKPPPPLPEG